MDNIHLELSDRLAAAMASGNIGDFAAIWTDDAVLWHNYDSKLIPKEEFVAGVANMHSLCTELAFVDRVVYSIPIGFVSQQRFVGVSRSGASFDVPACIVGHVRDGKLARVDEYVDPTSIRAALSH